MPGKPRLPQAEASPVRCPVHRVDITPCDVEELAPLLAHLIANLPVHDNPRFPRGALMDDGRLDLCKQSLGADNCLRIAHALQHNTQVRSLMLGTDAIGDAGAGAVARLAEVNGHLEVLYLGCNNIGPQGAERLGTALAQGSQVSGLWLKRNPLGPEGVQSLARMLRSNRHLRVLDLVNTDLQEAGLQALVDALCTDNRTLQALYLSGNGLGPSAAVSLTRLLREAPHVKALYLSVNRLGDQGAIALAQGLADNRTLQTLELASNGIGPEGAEALCAALRQHRELRHLNLGYAPSTRVLGAQANTLGLEGAQHAAHLLEAATALQKLDLARTGLTARGMEAVIEAACRHDRLQNLVLDSPLPEQLVRHLASNVARHGTPQAPADQAMIKSIYR